MQISAIISHSTDASICQRSRSPTTPLLLLALLHRHGSVLIYPQRACFLPAPAAVMAAAPPPPLNFRVGPCRNGYFYDAAARNDDAVSKGRGRGGGPERVSLGLSHRPRDRLWAPVCCLRLQVAGLPRAGARQPGGDERTPQPSNLCLRHHMIEGMGQRWQRTSQTTPDGGPDNEGD